MLSAYKHVRDTSFRPVDHTAMRYIQTIGMTKEAPAKKPTFGAELIAGMKQVLAHQRGQIELEQGWLEPVDGNATRKQVNMSQSEFSRAYGISKRALQEWEQG